MTTCENPLIIDTTPAPQRGWTPALKARFLDRLAAHGNARAACRAVNLSHEAAYRLRRRDADFARGWKAAVLLARENGVQVLAEHAIEGFEEEVWYRGQHVGNRRRFDTRLLLAHLARLDKLADEEGAGADAARFDELLACIAGEEAPGMDEGDGLLPLRREGMADIAAEDAKEAVDRAWLDANGKPRKLKQPEWQSYRAECEAAAEQARVEAEAESDAWFARACAMVDAHAGWPGTCPAPGLPGHPLAGVLRQAQDERNLGSTTQPPFTLSSSTNPLILSLSKGHPELVEGPRTLSHASTSALARALAGPVRSWPGIDLIPCGRRSPKRSSHRSAIDFSRAAA